MRISRDGKPRARLCPFDRQTYQFPFRVWRIYERFLLTHRREIERQNERGIEEKEREIHIGVCAGDRRDGFN